MLGKRFNIMGKKKNNIFTKSVIAFAIIALISSTIAIFRYGWERVLDESLLYIVGFSISAFLFSIVAYFVYKLVKKK